jgi:hypothetical protein
MQMIAIALGALARKCTCDTVFRLMPHETQKPLSPPLVAFAAWLLPGLGHWLIGHHARGITIGLTIILMFLLGVLMGGIRIVEAPAMRGNPLAALLSRPAFMGQVLAGPIGVGSAWISARAAQVPGWRDSSARARLGEIATLYTAIAGMLNLMAMIDAGYRAGRIGAPA